VCSVSLACFVQTTPLHKTIKVPIQGTDGDSNVYKSSDLFEPLLPHLCLGMFLHTNGTSIWSKPVPLLSSYFQARGHGASDDDGLLRRWLPPQLALHHSPYDVSYPHILDCPIHSRYDCRSVFCCGRYNEEAMKCLHCDAEFKRVGNQIVCKDCKKFHNNYHRGDFDYAYSRFIKRHYRDRDFFGYTPRVK